MILHNIRCIVDICGMQLDDIKKSFDELIEGEARLRNTDYKERVKLLSGLERALLLSKDELFQALLADFGKPVFESNYSELYLSLAAIRKAKKNLKSWMTPQRVSAQMSVFGSKAWVIPESKGLSLIISPWNFPVMLAIGPLASALAAGCSVAIKPSEQTPACSAYIKKLIESCFSTSEVQVIEGDAEASKALLSLPFKHIFFTGSTAVGKLIMQAASKHLSTVTLELGGKSPLIVTGKVNLKDAARRIVFSKWLNAGQTCIAADTIYVDAQLHNELMLEIKAVAEELYNSEETFTEYSSIVNPHHWNRLKSIVSDAKSRDGEVLYASREDEKNMKFGLQVISCEDSDAKLRQEELFGPILSVVKIQSIEEAITAINSSPTPLSLYIFTKSKSIQKRLLREIPSGSVGINDVLGQFYHEDMGFGGLHSSGMGKSHGHDGFKAFSHEKSVLKRTLSLNWMELAFPPYTSVKKKIANFVVRHL